MSKKLKEAMAIMNELSLDERGQLAAIILAPCQQKSS